MELLTVLKHSRAVAPHNYAAIVEGKPADGIPARRLHAQDAVINVANRPTSHGRSLLPRATTSSRSNKSRPSGVFT